MALLEIQDVGHRFGGLVALQNVCLKARAGGVQAVIGPNGAGKTTLFNMISGVLRPDQGRILFSGTDITGWAPHRVARLGISRTFQNVSLFLSMTVLENVMLGRHIRTCSGFLSAALRLPGQHRETQATRRAAETCLNDLGIEALANRPAHSLSFGQRRLVELARALATEPRLLLLDEPASGLNTKETDELAGTIRKIRDLDITVLLVEHDMSLVMDVSDNILVLHYGKPIAEGSPSVVRNHPEVVAVYLGGTAAC